MSTQRKIAELSDSGLTVKVYRDYEWEVFVIKAYSRQGQLVATCEEDEKAYALDQAQVTLDWLVNNF